MDYETAREITVILYSAKLRYFMGNCKRERVFNILYLYIFILKVRNKILFSRLEII